MTAGLGDVIQGLGGLLPSANDAAKFASYQQGNLSPGSIYDLARSLPQTIGGIPGIGSKIPGLGKIALPTSKLPAIFSVFDTYRFGAKGEWQSTKYGADLNTHHPKLKFLFKVVFSGFASQDFYHYVHRVDKPKVRFNHTDVNYYNFRTRVLTSTTFEPLNMTILDEIGDSTNHFFANYLRERTGTGAGNYGIDRGFGDASSSRPYPRGYAIGPATGTSITVEQIFANGTLTNRFTFINPRIETMDFDELAMDETGGSMLHLTFSYDAINCETLAGVTKDTWGQTDLLRGGGTSGNENGGQSSSNERPVSSQSSGGSGIGGGGGSPTAQPFGAIAAAGNAVMAGAQNVMAGAMSAAQSIAPGLSSLGGSLGSALSSAQPFLGKIESDLSKSISGIQAGSNLPTGTLT